MSIIGNFTHRLLSFHLIKRSLTYRESICVLRLWIDLIKRLGVHSISVSLLFNLFCAHFWLFDIQNLRSPCMCFIFVYWTFVVCRRRTKNFTLKLETLDSCLWRLNLLSFWFRPHETTRLPALSKLNFFSALVAKTNKSSPWYEAEKTHWTYLKCERAATTTTTMTAGPII